MVDGCSTGSPMGTNPVQRRLPDDPTGYYKTLRAAWDRNWQLGLLANTTTGSSTTNTTITGKFPPICVYPGLAAYVVQKASADAIAAFHRSVTKGHGYDGLYLDMLCDDWWCNAHPPRSAVKPLGPGNELRVRTDETSGEWEYVI